MSRRDFHQLLLRYLSGECSAKEKEWIDSWYDELNKEFKGDKASIDLNSLEKELWEKINQQTQPSSSSKTISLSKTINFPKIWLVAASCSVLLLSTLWFVQKRLEEYPTDASFVSNVPTNEITTIRNDTDSVSLVVLPDSSTIKLFAKASLRYAATFLDNREVHVTGDAYFQVKANASRPFYVFHNTTITKVLGTSFLIRKMPGKETEEITVFSGKVEVIDNSRRKNVLKRVLSKPEKVQLTTNHRAVLDDAKGRLEEGIAAHPVPVSPTILSSVSLNFTEITLHELSSRLEAIYGLPISLDPSLTNTTFTGDIQDMSLFDQLDIICEVTQTNYTVKGKKILIKQ
ncbi:FecR family protein [Olivibacter sp. SDN3]|uniref:FecR family protein n=1 Tax=Olivibacter sp. SDN3 TaxID=2764720 RepID=UPI0016510961|nr:FecR family protein [Olivibacter sp. SDN3]QNL49152.1 FecR family protein [Olivibacter sp. SDN3]